MKNFFLKNIEREYHSDKFREQIFALYPTGIREDTDDIYVKIIRTHLKTCMPGSASLDDRNPGSDTAEAWHNMDSLIENDGVRGFFHTHPSGFNDFSSQDLLVIRSLAISNGKRLLWHGVQSVSSKSSHFIAAQFISGNVIIHDLGWFTFDLEDPVLLLPAPNKIYSTWNDRDIGNNMIVMQYYD